MKKEQKTEKDFSKPLLEWSATYGENYEDIRASMYSPEMMQEFGDFFAEKVIKYCKKYPGQTKHMTPEFIIKQLNKL